MAYEWKNFNQDSFDAPDCQCAHLDNHVYCPIHGVRPWGGELAYKYARDEFEICTEEALK